MPAGKHPGAGRPKGNRALTLIAPVGLAVETPEGFFLNVVGQVTTDETLDKATWRMGLKGPAP
jgi:hypothetical protein